MLADVRRAAATRSSTAESLAVLERGAEVPRGGTVDPRHALPVPVELEPVLGGGLRRGSVVAAAGSGSLLLSVLGAAHGAGAWAAIVGQRTTFAATAAIEFAVDLGRVALIPNPGNDWARVAAALIAGVDLLVVYPTAAVPDAMASRLQARARKAGCVLVVVGPTAGARVWPGPDLVVEAIGHRFHGLGAGRGRLRLHEIQVSVTRRRGGAQAPMWVPMPPPSLAAIAGPQPGPQPGAVPDFGLPDSWPTVRRTHGTDQRNLRPVSPRPAVEDPWAAHLVTDDAWAARRAKTA
ncbi:hypothetical protein ACQP2P_16205 [Dactylosporangium sp. CA-139114]|uniref:hypothetical protein n=1 Tax=Dactylosporangium sp. CA-139114 TaxID=3239931 RepID=UPI003D9525C3